MLQIFHKGKLYVFYILQGDDNCNTRFLSCFVNLSTRCFMLKCDVGINLKWGLKVFFSYDSFNSQRYSKNMWLVVVNTSVLGKEK